MSVYLPKTGRFFQYDFQYKGKRYTGSTGVEARRKAEEVEKRIREEVALGRFDDDALMTLDQAAGRWWTEVGRGLATGKAKRLSSRDGAALSDVERRLEILLRLLGPETRLIDITTRKVSAAIEKRRRETYTKAKDQPGKLAKRYPVSNATVNADIIGMLRRIMGRAERVWEVKPLAKIDWKALKLREPEPEIRVYSSDQRAAWQAECDPVAAKALEFLLRYGLRLNELFFAPDAFKARDEFAGPRLEINKRKRGAMMLPLREQDGRDVAARAGRAVAAGLNTIWFEELVIPAAGRREEQVNLIPLTYYGLQARLRSAARRAGIDVPRIIHGARHHAGTVFLAKTGNLKLTQDLLGHADIKSTIRYAKALEADLREALEDGPKSRLGPEHKRGRRGQGSEK